MSIVLQEAGCFIESSEKIYFAHNFALYFYKIPTKDDDKITNSFHYITEEEYEKNVIQGTREFMLIKDSVSLPEFTFDMEFTNIILPPQAVDDCIAKFQTLFADALTSAQLIEKLANDTEKMTSITEEELRNIIN